MAKETKILVALFTLLVLSDVCVASGDDRPFKLQAGGPQVLAGGGGTHRCPTGAVQTKLAVELTSQDPAVDVFNPVKPRDMLTRLKNTGSGDVDLIVTTSESSVGLSRRVLAGESLIDKFRGVVDVQVACLPSLAGVASCNVDLDLVYGPEEPDPIDDFALEAWYVHVCVDDDFNVPPDQDIDCLWEMDTIWTSNTPELIDLYIEVTRQDLQIEIEYSNNIIQQYNLSADALPQFRVLFGEWDDVVAVHVLCKRSPADSCGPCEYYAKICEVD